MSHYPDQYAKEQKMYKQHALPDNKQKLYYQAAVYVNC